MEWLQEIATYDNLVTLVTDNIKDIVNYALIVVALFIPLIKSRITRLACRFFPERGKVAKELLDALDAKDEIYDKDTLLVGGVEFITTPSKLKDVRIDEVSCLGHVSKRDFKAVQLKACALVQACMEKQRLASEAVDTLRVRLARKGV